MSTQPDYTPQQLAAGYREWRRLADAAFASGDGALSSGFSLRAQRCLELLRDKLGLKNTDEAATFARKKQA